MRNNTNEPVMNIKRIIVGKSKPLQFMCFGRLEIICPDYDVGCIDVTDFAFCAVGGDGFPPAGGKCPMIDWL